MKLLLDSKQFGSSFHLSGYFVIGFLLFIYVSMSYLFWEYVDLKTVFFYISYLLLSIGFCMAYGMMFSPPLRVYDEGVSIRTTFRLTPVFIPFSEIREMKLYREMRSSANAGVIGYMGHCTVKTESRTYTSPEHFSTRDFKDFVQALEPIMKDKGLSKDEVDYKRLFVSFRR